MRKLLLLLFFVFLVRNIFAQAPSNDDCANAIVLTSAGVCSPTAGTNIGVVSTDYDPCAEFDKRNVWYKFTATSANQIIQLTRGTIQNVAIDVWSNCSGTEVNTCDIGSNSAVITRTLSGLTANTEYYISVSTREESEEGTFEICLITPPVPVNNECATAVSLSVHPSGAPTNRINGSTTFATQSLAGCSGIADDDVWYSFTATQSAHRLFLKSLSFTGNLVAELFSGNCEALVTKQCISTGFSSIDNSSALFTDLTPSVTYFLRVYSSGGTGHGGTFSIAITSTPTNDNCLQATALTASVGEDFSGAILGSSFEATQSSTSCTGTNATNDDVWYSFVATQTVHKIKVKGWPSSQARIEGFSGTCAALVSLGCNMITHSGDTTITSLTNLSVGQTYFFRTYSFSSTTSTASRSIFLVGVTSPIISPIDECATALNIVPSATSVGNEVIVSLANSFPSVITGTCNNISRDIYLKFTATNTQHQIKVKSIQNTSFTVSFLSGICGNLQALRCRTSSDSISNMGNLVIGQTYFFRITNDLTSASTFRVSITSPNYAPNDECSGAIAIIPSGGALDCNTFTGNFQNSSQSLIKECNAGTGTNNSLVKDIWYKFTATASQHRVTFTSISGFEFKFELYAGSCGTLTYIDCSSEVSTFNEKTFSALTVGDEYFIRVFSTNSGDITFEGCVKALSPPANDLCTNATLLSVNPTWSLNNYVKGSTFDSNITNGSNTCGPTNPYDVWYKFEATTTSATITLRQISVINNITNPVIAVYGGNCETLTHISCKSGSYLSTSEVFLRVNSLVVGQIYFIRIYSATATVAAQGNFLIQVNQEVEAPLNDNCETPQNLPIQSNWKNVNYTTANTTFATAGTQTQGCTGVVNADDDVWFSFTASKTRIRLQIKATFSMPNFIVYSGDCNSPTALFCSTSESSNTTQDRIINSLNVGQTYLIRVYSLDNSSIIRGRFNIALSDDTDVPSNDLCANATTLAVSANSTPQFTMGSNIMANNEATNCNNGADVWFKFVATATSHRILYEGYLQSPNLAVFSGTCGAFSSVSGCMYPTKSVFGFTVSALTIGTEYYILVGSSQPLTSQSKFNIAVTKALAPVNDQCSGAIPLINNSFHTTDAATGDTPDCYPQAKQDVWFTMLATHTKMNVGIENLSTNSAVSVYSGSCGSLNMIGCSYSTQTFGLKENILNLTNLTIGETYFVRVISTGGSIGSEIPLEFRIHTYPATELNENTLYANTCMGTNMLPNPGFEYYESCPTNFIPTPASPGQWLSPNNFWKIPTMGSSDFFNDCGEFNSNIETPFNARFGIQAPRNGSGYGGFFSARNDYREYLETKMNDPMVIGKRYLLSMWVSRADYMHYASNNIGFGLHVGSKVMVTYDTISVMKTILPTTNTIITETENWVNVSAEFTADQPYTHLYLGNFEDDRQTLTSFNWSESNLYTNFGQDYAYYYVDDIFVGEIDNTIACGANNCNSTIVLTSPTDDISGATVTKSTNIELKANITIQGSSNVLFQSGKSILMDAAQGVFEVKNGVVFEAKIGGCVN